MDRSSRLSRGIYLKFKPLVGSAYFSIISMIEKVYSCSSVCVRAHVCRNGYGCGQGDACGRGVWVWVWVKVCLCGDVIYMQRVLFTQIDILLYAQKSGKRGARTT